MDKLNCDFKVEKLKLESCVDLTDKGLSAIMTKFGPTLKYLDLSDTNITGGLFSDFLFDCCPKLEHMDLYAYEHSMLTKSARKILKDNFEIIDWERLCFIRSCS